MKKLGLLLLILTVLPFITYGKDSKKHNRIDDLLSANDVRNFLHGLERPFLKLDLLDTLPYYHKFYQKVFDSLHVKFWDKADFDNNGYTDLVAICFQGVFCIMDSGENRFSIKQITYDGSVNGIAKVEHQKSRDILDFLVSGVGWKIFDTVIKITSFPLIYKYGGFIELNDSVHRHIVKSLKLTSRGGMMAGNLFFYFDSTGKSVYFSSSMRNPTKDTLTCTIDKKKYNEIIDLINYMGLDKLAKSYHLGATDLSTANLEIIYDDDRKKFIGDYGWSGTFGLKCLYTRIGDLTKNQKWKNQKK